jgi:hypothetical protein
VFPSPSFSALFVQSIVEQSFHSDLIAATKNSPVVEFAGCMAAGLRVFDPKGMLPEADGFCFDVEVALVRYSELKPGLGLGLEETKRAKQIEVQRPFTVEA